MWKAFSAIKSVCSHYVNNDNSDEEYEYDGGASHRYQMGHLV